jgi:hypothetical protein
MNQQEDPDLAALQSAVKAGRAFDQERQRITGMAPRAGASGKSVVLAILAGVLVGMLFAPWIGIIGLDLAGPGLMAVLGWGSLAHARAIGSNHADIAQAMLILAWPVLYGAGAIIAAVGSLYALAGRPGLAIRVGGLVCLAGVIAGMVGFATLVGPLVFLLGITKWVYVSAFTALAYAVTGSTISLHGPHVLQGR